MVSKQSKGDWDMRGMKKINKLLGLGLCALGLSVLAQSASADVLKENCASPFRRRDRQ